MSENKKSFLEQMSELWPNLDFSNSIYINYYTKIEFICSEHGKQYKLPKYIKKYGCGICSRKNTYKKMTESNLLKIPQEDVIKECNEIHNNRYNYSLVKYKGSHVPIVVICPIHGQFETLPHNHKRGVGCIKCRNNLLSEKYRSSTEDFIEKALKIHGDKYDYSKVICTKTIDTVVITCPIHGEFEQTVQAHLRGSGCPTCAKTGFDRTKPAILYYLSINNGEAYKIGITNKSVKDRFNSTDLKKITILKEWEYPIGYDAYKAEQRILSMYKNFKYEGKPILATGNTELFTTNVLEIDTL